MKNEQEKSNIIKTTNYLNQKYRHSSLRKFVIKSYYDKNFPQRKLSEDPKRIDSTKTNLNYKNPKFFNEKNLDLILNNLKKFSKENSNKDKINRRYTYTKKFINCSENEALPVLKRNNTTYSNIKLNTDNIIKNDFSHNNLINRRNTYYFSRSNTEGNISNENSKINKNEELSINKLYKIIFKSQLPKSKDHIKPIIENKYNLKFAENEEEYNSLIEKEYQEKISKGKKVKSKKSNTSTKLKLEEALDKVNFMKDVIDYSYPLFVLSKIKIKQKNLMNMKKQRNNTFVNFTTEKDKRLKEIKMRDEKRTKYLLKSFSFFK